MTVEPTLAQLEAAATPGPWEADVFPEGAVVRSAGGTRSILRSHNGTPCLAPADARLIAALRNRVPAATELASDTEAIHDYFGLSYSTYLVLHRTLLQSMPDQWQAEFVALLRQLEAAFDHVEKTESYDLIPGTQHLVSELDAAQRAAAGITSSWDEMTAAEAEAFDGEVEYVDRYGNIVEPYERVIVPGEELLPPYSRGRTRVDPDLDAYHEARAAAAHRA